MLFAFLLILSLDGSTYAFGIYSREHRSAMGTNVSIPAGLLNEVTPPWVVLTVGAAMNLTWYLMVYFSLASRVVHQPIWLICAYIYAGH